MILQVNATRMELLQMKKKLIIAKKGHKLLKDKEDELMRQLLEMIKSIRELRKEVENEISSVVGRYQFAKASMNKETEDEIFLIPTKKIDISVIEKNLMSVRVPEFTKEVEGKIRSYGYAFTSGELDASLLALDKIMEKVVSLAEKEKTIQLLADEIEKTRRRVNALEYIMIPNIEDTIKYISQRLAEIERSNTTRLMKVKDIVRAH
ncbi:V-type ATP synthase subunit D [candidate division WOR-3 bacterium]|nr:V-type ATP synthase subunit D [candidate division WOR-3 bacterium]